MSPAQPRCLIRRAGTFGDLVLLQRSRSGHTATLFSNDTVWLAGGGNNTIESFDASAGAFTLSDTAMTAVRSGHEAIALSSTSVLFFGGDTNHTIDQFNPSTGELSLVNTDEWRSIERDPSGQRQDTRAAFRCRGSISPDAADRRVFHLLTRPRCLTARCCSAAAKPQPNFPATKRFWWRAARTRNTSQYFKSRPSIRPKSGRIKMTMLQMIRCCFSVQAGSRTKTFISTQLIRKLSSGRTRAR